MDLTLWNLRRTHLDRSNGFYIIRDYETVIQFGNSPLPSIDSGMESLMIEQFDESNRLIKVTSAEQRKEERD